MPTPPTPPTPPCPAGSGGSGGRIGLRCRPAARAPGGQTAVSKSGNTTCLEAFEGFAGVGYDSSDVDFIAIYPSEETWTRIDDRTVFCSVADPSGPTTGSLAGVGR